MGDKLFQIVVVLILAVYGYAIFLRPKPGRFQPIPEKLFLAVDTQTGRACATGPFFGDDPQAIAYKRFPMCTDLH